MSEDHATELHRRRISVRVLFPPFNCICIRDWKKMDGQKWYYHSNITAEINKTNNTVQRVKQTKGKKQEKAEIDAYEI